MNGRKWTKFGGICKSGRLIEVIWGVHSNSEPKLIFFYDDPCVELIYIDSLHYSFFYKNNQLTITLQATYAQTSNKLSNI